jgi:hypothetical protein
MEEITGLGDPGDGGALASHRLPVVLGLAFAKSLPAGRKPLSREVRELIFRMVAENPTWGAPRIHGELLKLGFEVSERTVSRWIKRASKNPDPTRRWLVFLHNHREAIAAMDFFTVPTLTFGVLYCFFLIDHDRRRILQLNVTRNPNTHWVALQLC